MSCQGSSAYSGQGYLFRLQELVRFYAACRAAYCSGLGMLADDY